MYIGETTFRFTTMSGNIVSRDGWLENDFTLKRSPLFFQAGLFSAQERTYLQLSVKAANFISLFIIYYSYKPYLDLADPATVSAC